MNHSFHFRILTNAYWQRKVNADVHIIHGIKNVQKDSTSNKFWLLDNEQAMFEGAKFLFSTYNKKEYTDFFWLHERILNILCVFRTKTIENIRRLATMESPTDYLLQTVREKEPLYDLLSQKIPIKPLTKELFESKFKPRLLYLLSWVEYCKM